MKIKLDENLPVRSAQRLRDLGHDVDTVLDEGLGPRKIRVLRKRLATEG